MYICVCHAVTEKDIRRAVACGAESLSQLSEALPIAASCGACLENAKCCLDEAKMTTPRMAQGRPFDGSLQGVI
ncbi:MAG: (2Fe-2S)-binding protein [Gammaproteobacteria bacterium]|jgi:bacterioferritin-associated ferredoxin